jgi:hypothetical protein
VLEEAAGALNEINAKNKKAVEESESAAVN